MTEECDLHLFQQLQIEAFEIVWAKIESTIKVLCFFYQTLHLTAIGFGVRTEFIFILYP